MYDIDLTNALGSLLAQGEWTTDDRLILSDLLSELNRDDESALVRDLDKTIIIVGRSVRDKNSPYREGDEVVTVGRYGARTASTGKNHSVGVYTTKVYKAVKTKKGLQWKLLKSVDRHSTASKYITGPMAERAKAYANETGRSFQKGILQYSVCK
jgi:TFIIF-interacting CTD phosphatase-like protein